MAHLKPGRTTSRAMPNRETTQQALVDELAAYVDRAVHAMGGSTTAIKPGHRVKFHWPPHPISYEFHVQAKEWTGKASFEAYGETFDVEVARTHHGVFGRCEALWHEDRGDNLQDMLENLRQSSEPLLSRQLTIAKTLEREGRFVGHISELPPSDLLKLMYCSNRDVAKEAQSAIEGEASTGLFLPSLLYILRDRRHPLRRSAQWLVLDLFEDLPSFAHTEAEQEQAGDAVRDLIWDAEDDYARTIYKAGVVFGGHVPTQLGARVLIQCLYAPSKIGRRSAIHGVFHIVEWAPQYKERIVAELRRVSVTDPEPLLQHFATAMANDVEAGALDHIQEPDFPDEI